MRGRTVSPWLVRRKPGNRRIFQVVSFDEIVNGDPVVAEEFKDINRAQEFAAEANLLIGRVDEFVNDT